MASLPDSVPATLFNPAYRRAKQDQRFDTSPEQYLAMHNIPEYLSDAIRLMTEADDAAPLEFLSAYFQNVLTGDNVIFRNFAYIDATNRNRRSFIRRLRETYQNFSPDEEISVESLHQLFCLLCPDYPIHYIRCAVRIYHSSRKLSSNQQQHSVSESAIPKTAPFADFLQFACLFLYFSKFISLCGKFFVEHGHSDSTFMDKRILQHYFVEITDTDPTLAMPDQQILSDILQQYIDGNSAPGTISFDLFCSALFNHKDIAMALLEPRSYTELKEGIDRLLERLSVEQNLEIVRGKRKPKRNDKKDNTA